MLLPRELKPDNPLWRFALAFWQQPQVESTCLALQSEGWSVNKILCAGWLALEGRRYAGIEDATVTEWREHVTGALRTARQRLPREPAPVAGLRRGLADLELEAERLELALVWHALSKEPPDETHQQGRDMLIRHNLAAAAPGPDQAERASTALNSLARALAAFPKGDRQP